MDSKTSQIEPKKLGFTWTPPGILTSSKIQRYFDQLPQEKVPRIGSSGEKFRDKQLALQLPRQDLTINYCKHVDTEHRASYDDFIAARNEIALDVGFVRDAAAAGKCQTCSEAINQGEMCVNAPKLSDEVSATWLSQSASSTNQLTFRFIQINFHPRCFKCTTCEELLVDLTYCVFDGSVYCERHYAEMLKPRCSSCDEVSRAN
jgi:prickle